MVIDFTLWLIIALCASLIANFFAFWYIRKVLGKLMFVGENLSDLVALIDAYKVHLKAVYELEQYYGDEQIKFLISHTNSLIEMLEDYEDVYSIATPMPEIEIQEEEIEQDAETQINQENVFYAGTRRRDN